LGAGTSGWAAPLTNYLYSKVVWINPVTGNSGSTQGNASLGRIPMWGFATNSAGTATVPGPRIEVGANQVADGLVLIVSNQLPVPISLVIPGLNGNSAAGQPVKFPANDPNYPDRVRSLVPEVAPLGVRHYVWTGPLKLGTYAYHSGTHLAVQVQMGLYGMVTVRSNLNQVYPGIQVPANRDTPVIFSEVDPVLHWRVHTNDYGPGKTISSTLHSDPSLFMINGRAFSRATPPPNNHLTSGARSVQTLFRFINFCWDSRIPTLAGPVPSNRILPASDGHYLTLIAEDGNLYPFRQAAYAPNLSSMKTMDVLFTPPNPGGPALPVSYGLYDHRLGLSNPSGEQGGMYARWIVQ